MDRKTPKTAFLGGDKRLALVFLPLTALTGLFGASFNALVTVALGLFQASDGFGVIDWVFMADLI